MYIGIYKHIPKSSNHREISLDTTDARSNPLHLSLNVFSGAKDSKAVAKFSSKSVLPPIRGFPEVRACMEEKDFHVSIIKGKEKVTLLEICRRP